MTNIELNTVFVIFFALIFITVLSIILLRFTLGKKNKLSQNLIEKSNTIDVDRKRKIDIGVQAASDFRKIRKADLYRS